MRPKGIPNKATRKRLSVADELDRRGIDLIDEIFSAAVELKGKDRVDMLMKLLEYCAPKMRAIEIAPGDSDDDKDKVLDLIPKDKMRELLSG